MDDPIVIRETFIEKIKRKLQQKEVPKVETIDWGNMIKEQNKGIIPIPDNIEIIPIPDFGMTINEAGESIRKAILKINEKQ